MNGDRIVAHIAYELLRRLDANPGIQNEELFRDVQWILALLGRGSELLSAERQLGLAGECTFLRKLLIAGSARGVASSSVLARWFGHNTAKRDFAAEGVVVEVKATSNSARIHEISSLDQLEPHDAGESVYVFSIGLRLDASAPRKLPHLIADVEAQITTHVGKPDLAAIDAFRSQVAAYGYDFKREESYRGQPGFLSPHLPGAIFDERRLERLRMDSFVNSSLPSMVLGLTYTLQLTCAPLDDDEFDAVLARLVTSPPVSFQT